jgi:ketosteroid isomerase-like protein
MGELDDFARTLEQQRWANDAMFSGDPEPYMSMWSCQDPVSLFGAWGPCQTGWDDISRTLRWVGTRFADGRMSFDLDVIHAGADAAHTVGYEQGWVRLDGALLAPMRIRVTHVYRREPDGWRIVHRHGDFAPQDESLAS